MIRTLEIYLLANYNVSHLTVLNIMIIFTNMIIMFTIHLNTLNVDPPRISGLVQADLHVVCNSLALCKDVPKCLRAQDVPVILRSIYTMWRYIGQLVLKLKLNTSLTYKSGRLMMRECVIFLNYWVWLQPKVELLKSWIFPKNEITNIENEKYWNIFLSVVAANSRADPV